MPHRFERVGNDGGFELMYDDWKLLRDIVLDENSKLAPPITGDARDLVLQLTAIEPSLRVEHEQVRTHPYFQSMELPPSGAAIDTIREWVEQL